MLQRITRSPECTRVCIEARLQRPPKVTKRQARSCTSHQSSTSSSSLSLSPFGPIAHFACAPDRRFYLFLPSLFSVSVPFFLPLYLRARRVQSVAKVSTSFANSMFRKDGGKIKATRPALFSIFRALLVERTRSK